LQSDVAAARISGGQGSFVRRCCVPVAQSIVGVELCARMRLIEWWE